MGTKNRNSAASLCLGEALGGSCCRQLPPYPPSGMTIMRLCSLLSQPCQGDHVLFFWVCSLPNISSRVSRRTSSRSMSIRPTTSPPNSTTTEKSSRQGGEKASARALSQGTSTDRTTRARRDAHLSACSAMDLAGSLGIQRDSCFSPRRRNLFDTSARRSQPELKSFLPQLVLVLRAGRIGQCKPQAGRKR